MKNPFIYTSMMAKITSTFILVLVTLTSWAQTVFSGAPSFEPDVLTIPLMVGLVSYLALVQFMARIKLEKIETREMAIMITS
jgi:uncharacterized membrane protein YkvI